MLSHSSQDQIFSTSSLTTTKSFITILLYMYNERLLPFLWQFLLNVCVNSQRRPAANTQNNGLYNIIKYHMMTVTKEIYILY